MPDERSWWRWALRKLTVQARAGVKLLVARQIHGGFSEWRPPKRGWVKQLWIELRQDPYQRRLLPRLAGAGLAYWLIAPLGHQAAMIVHGWVGVALALPLVLSPAILLLECVRLAYRSWVFQELPPPLTIGGEG